MASPGYIWESTGIHGQRGGRLVEKTDQNLCRKAPVCVWSQAVRQGWRPRCQPQLRPPLVSTMPPASPWHQTSSRSKWSQECSSSFCFLGHQLHIHWSEAFVSFLIPWSAAVGQPVGAEGLVLPRLEQEGELVNEWGSQSRNTCTPEVSTSGRGSLCKTSHLSHSWVSLKCA